MGSCFFQRGDVGGSAKKVGLRIKELERLYGISHGGHGSNQYVQNPNKLESAKTQQDLASDLGMNIETLRNYKLLADMIPELEELLDTRIVTKTTALAMMKELSIDEQEEMTKVFDNLDFYGTRMILLKKYILRESILYAVEKSGGIYSERMRTC